MLTRLRQSLTDPAATIELADVEAAAAEYPFFTLPAVMMLRRQGDTLDDDTHRRLMAVIALNAPDPASLFMLVTPESEALRSFYPPEQTKVTTTDAISKFLDTYGQTDPAQEALLERLIFNPVAADYTTILEKEAEASPRPAEAAPASEHDLMLEAFLERSAAEGEEPTITPAEPLHEPEPIPREPVHTPVVTDTSLSETLAKTYIRQKRYDKAFEIIHTLSLNNPKKSAYFADQLRYLAKVMLVKERQNH